MQYSTSVLANCQQLMLKDLNQGTSAIVTYLGDVESSRLTEKCRHDFANLLIKTLQICRLKTNDTRVAFLYERPFLSLHALQIRKV